ncbi:hypothetical protein ADUPG1_004521, partial [Aduncisulcus paluster]
MVSYLEMLTDHLNYPVRRSKEFKYYLFEIGMMFITGQSIWYPSVPFSFRDDLSTELWLSEAYYDDSLSIHFSPPTISRSGTEILIAAHAPV